MAIEELVQGELYRHFKGKLYQILNIAYMEDTNERMVVYQALYGDYKVYVRSYDSFSERVDKIKYPKVNQEYRFERVTTEEKWVMQAQENSMQKERELSRVNMTELSSGSTERDNSGVNPSLISFLDAVSYSDKIRIMYEIKKNMDEKIMSAIEASLDLAYISGSMEERFERVKDNLMTRVEYEGTRLR